DVQSAAPDGILRHYGKPEALSDRREESREFTVHVTCALLLSAHLWIMAPTAPTAPPMRCGRSRRAASLRRDPGDASHRHLHPSARHTTLNPASTSASTLAPRMLGLSTSRGEACRGGGAQ